jgi:hypothetical protein
MNANPSGGDLVLAFVDRLIADSTFAAAVGVDADSTVKLTHRWPVRLLEKPTEDALPLVVYTITATLPRTTTQPPRVLIATDIFEWPIDADSAATRGLAKLFAIDDAMLTLLFPDETASSWYDAARDLDVSCISTESTDPPSSILRRRRLWEMAEA